MAITACACMPNTHDTCSAAAHTTRPPVRPSCHFGIFLAVAQNDMDMQSKARLQCYLWACKVFFMHHHHEHSTLVMRSCRPRGPKLVCKGHRVFDIIKVTHSRSALSHRLDSQDVIRHQSHQRFLCRLGGHVDFGCIKISRALCKATVFSTLSQSWSHHGIDHAGRCQRAAAGVHAAAMRASKQGMAARSRRPRHELSQRLQACCHTTAAAPVQCHALRAAGAAEHRCAQRAEY